MARLIEVGAFALFGGHRWAVLWRRNHAVLISLAVALATLAATAESGAPAWPSHDHSWVPAPVPEQVPLHWVLTGTKAAESHRTDSPAALQAANAEISRLDLSAPDAEIRKVEVLVRHQAFAAALDVFRKHEKTFLASVEHCSPELVTAISSLLLSDRQLGGTINLCRHFLFRGSKDKAPSDSDKAKVQLLLGDAYFRADRYDIARDEYTTVLTLWPDAPEAVEARFKVAEALTAQRIFGKAEEILEALSAETDESTVVRASLRLAVLYYGMGDMKRGRECLDELLTRRPRAETTDMLLYLYWLTALCRLGVTYPEASSSLPQVKLESPYAVRHEENRRQSDAPETYTFPGLSVEQARRRCVPERLIGSATRALRTGNLESARAQFQHIYLLGAASRIVHRNWNDDPMQLAASVLRAIEAAAVDARVRKFPELGKQLEGSLRNCTVARALERILKGTGFRLTVLPGTEEDAGRLLLGRELSVVYLSLDGKTVARALSDVLSSFHIAWRFEPERQEIVVATQRRLPGRAPWVYDTSGILFPLTSEIGADTLLAAENARAAIGRSVRDFLTLLNAITPSGDELGTEPGSVLLMDLSRLLVYGDAKTHRTVSRLLEALIDEGPDPADVLGRLSGQSEMGTFRRLRQVAAPRMAAYRKAQAIAARSAARGRSLAMLEAYAWRLLAESLSGALSQETLAHVLAAWRAHETHDLADTHTLLTLSRSAYAVVESATMVHPAHPDLQKLSRDALRFLPKLRRPARRLTYTRVRNPRLPLIYIFLAVRAAKRAEAGLPPLGEELERWYRFCSQGQMCGGLCPRTVDELALCVRYDSAASAARVEKWFTSDITTPHFSGDDGFVLKALTARHLGPRAWEAFGKARSELIRKVRPSRSAILLADGLSKTRPASTGHDAQTAD